MRLSLMKSLELSSRGEMGALPDDAKQDLKIMYLQVKYLKEVVKQLKLITLKN